MIDESIAFPTDDELRSRLKNFEDNFVERKTYRDGKKEWIKAAVAFANSAPVGFPAVLYVGAKNNGDVEPHETNLDKLQQTINEEMRNVYPRVPYLQKIIKVEANQLLAVIVFGSAFRPHFAGPAYVREGSESIQASERSFQELIASRSSKTFLILQYKNKQITVLSRRLLPNGLTSEVPWKNYVVIEDCNQFWVTLLDGTTKRSYVLDRIDLNFDNENRRLKLELLETQH